MGKLLVLLVLLMSSPLYADEVIVAGLPLTDRVAIVVDGSGSMHPVQLPIAIKWARRLIEGMSDDGHLRVYLFEETVTEQGGWIRLPDADAVNEALAWLSEVGSGGGTEINNAIISVLQRNPEPDLTVVVITDAVDPGANAERVQAVNNARPHGPARIAILQIHNSCAANKDFATKVAVDTGATYYRADAAASREEQGD